MGKLIVIEGLDGSGKTTQVDLLRKKFGNNAKYIKFPNYSDDSSALIKMYLSGELGASADSVNAYAASLLYSVDRFASYKKYWQEDYLDGKTILCDRYTTSNAIHQMSKLPPEQWEFYLNWLYDTEFNKMCIPKPDAVIFLDVPVHVSQRLMTERYKGDEKKKDIHESDIEYLNRCYECAKFAAEYFGWTVIKCTDEENMRSIEDIEKDIEKALQFDVKGD